VYLSDVRPAQIDQRAGAVGFDRTFYGRPLILDGKRCEKGLGVKLPSRLSFDLGGQFRTLSAHVVLEDPPALLGGEQVTVQVMGNGKALAAFRLGQDKTEVSLEADVRGVRTLRLNCLPSSPDAYQASVNWCSPMLRR
ncbi:MAG: NPCBM/NEW2 domain-containing protein, partial [Planctomycetes bacterium]|nr:NPCBM/NEW2 domain-containing protein [Planctomycetota bacterium]